MRAFAFLLMLALALAGCADSGDDGGGDGGATPTPTPAGNAAPTGSFTGTPASGDAPLDVVFSASASDADGDALSWELDADGDGSPERDGDEGDLPVEYTHSYDAGSYTAVFTVRDGEDTLQLTQAIEASEPAAEGEEPVDDGLCHAAAADYTPIPPAPAPAVFYVYDTWLYQESNGVDGLQLDAGPSAIGETHIDGCTGGDTVVI